MPGLQPQPRSQPQSGRRATNPRRRRIVVVGNGMVGHRFVEAAIDRGLTQTHDIVVLGEEPRPAYDRVALTSYFEVGAQALSLLPNGRYPDDAVELRLGASAVAVSPRQRIVTLADGEDVPYDELVLATGAAPFVPPVPGHDLPGAFVYRTIDDLEAIRKAARSRGVTRGAVIGGGLLGLEAANALHGLGLQTHVVELAPRLMAVQVDDARRPRPQPAHRQTRTHRAHRGQDRGGARAAARVTGLALADREPLDVDLVVFSAGIRPRDELARTAACARPSAAESWSTSIAAPPTSTSGRSASAPRPAAGCTAWSLRATRWPRWSPMPWSVARAASPAPTCPPSSSCSGSTSPASATPMARPTVPSSSSYADDVAGVYKKLVISEDGKRLLGGILVGDASSYGVLRPMVSSGAELPGNPEDLILPIGGGGAAITLPAAAQVCSCNNVSKGAIEQAVAGGCVSVAEVGAQTKAGTTCGSCKPQVKKIVEDWFAASGQVVDRSICEHFAYTRAELFDLVLVHQYHSFDEIARSTRHRQRLRDLQAGGRLDPGLAVQRPRAGRRARRRSRTPTTHFLANIQRNGTYSVVPRVAGGEITPEKLIVIGEVARDFGLYTKITGGQRIDLLGAQVEQLPAIWRRLVDAGFESGHAYGKALRTVKSCVGSTWCRYGVQDRVGLAIELELRYRGLRAPHKLKGGVSGCARECAEAQGKDFGVIATEKGWNLYVCGNGGAMPAPRTTARRRPVDRRADPLPRPLLDVLHPHRRSAAAHVGVDRVDRGRPGEGARRRDG